jgi:hypothetical protein
MENSQSFPALLQVSLTKSEFIECPHMMALIGSASFHNGNPRAAGAAAEQV